jgi:hypothetical protein
LKRKRITTSTVILLTLLSLSSTRSLAQIQVDLGVKGGVNLAGLSVDIYTLDGSRHVLDSRKGLIAGAFLTINVNDYLAFQPEVLFTQKGTEWNRSWTEFTYTGTRLWDCNWEDKLNYLEVPVLAKLKAPVWKSLQPSLYVGPAVAFKLSAKKKWESTVSDPAGGTPEYDSGDEDVGKSFEDTDLGITFGGDLTIDVKSAKIVIDARYTLGLTTIDEHVAGGDSKVGTYRNGDMKNEVKSFLIGFALPLRL